jgi:hypothetical protein
MLGFSRERLTSKSRFVLGRVLLLFLVIVSTATELRSAALSSVLIRGVPHVRQKPDFCGEACAEMYLRKLRVPIDQDGVFDLSRLDPTLGRGCYTRDLMQALGAIGFKIGLARYEIPVRSAASKLNEEFAALHADLVAGVPSIVCMRFDEQPKTTEHFRLVLGYDAKSDEVIYHDPALASGAYRRMIRSRFLDLWPLKHDDEKWTIVRLRLETGSPLHAVRTPARSRNAEYAQHVRKLRARLPEGGFSIVVQKPFVVIGDEPADSVKDRARDTVQWAVDRLKRDYFDQDPSDILDIWLFRDSVSYEEHAEKLFGTKPSTPYGYYSPRDRALVMNIATGGGTLVHEIVHPFMASNFPECPAWFNEGLASLYERPSERAGHIIGLTNWRLKGLQRALRKGTVPTFKTLCETTTHEFYDQDRGTNYGQARYLCYYLQEQGLLVKFFHAFRKNVAADPSGYETLKSILGEEAMTKFQERWQAYTLKLTFGD